MGTGDPEDGDVMGADRMMCIFLKVNDGSSCSESVNYNTQIHGRGLLINVIQAALFLGFLDF